MILRKKNALLITKRGVDLEQKRMYNNHAPHRLSYRGADIKARYENGTAIKRGLEPVARVHKNKPRMQILLRLPSG